EDITVDPRFGRGAALILADRVQQEQAVVLQAAPGNVEEGAMVLVADVFEHADRGDAVELSVLAASAAEVAVIDELELDRQSGAALPPEFRLGARDRDPDATRAVMLGGVAHQAAPAATDVEQAHAGAQAELAA